MSSSNTDSKKNIQWLDELRALGKNLNDINETDQEILAREEHYARALLNVEVYQEELRAQNEELNLARENAENALKKFSFLFENSPMGYFMIDERRTIEEVNSTGISMLAIDRVHLQDKPFLLFVAQQSRATLDAHFRTVFSGNRCRDEIFILKKNGESFPVIIESCPAQGDVVRGRRCLTIIFDITERKKFEADLQTANQNLELARNDAELASNAKSNFIAVMSHELRTPLNAILGFSQIIKDDLLGPKNVHKYSEYGRDIFESGQHLLTLVNDVLDISKIESGEVHIEPSHLEVIDIFQECARVFETKAEEKRLSLLFDNSCEPFKLYADRRAVLQMAFNLIANSLEYTPQGGRVIVKAECKNGHGPIISVMDTGIGIAQDRIGDVTKPFGRTDSPYEPRVSGTGLGLPITKGLIELHGGNIHIESEENKGTTVSLVFPSAKN